MDCSEFKLSLKVDKKLHNNPEEIIYIAKQNNNNKYFLVIVKNDEDKEKEESDNNNNENDNKFRTCHHEYNQIKTCIDSILKDGILCLQCENNDNFIKNCNRNDNHHHQIEGNINFNNQIYLLLLFPLGPIDDKPKTFLVKYSNTNKEVTLPEYDAILIKTKDTRIIKLVWFKLMGAFSNRQTFNIGQRNDQEYFAEFKNISATRKEIRILFLTIMIQILRPFKISKKISLENGGDNNNNNGDDNIDDLIKNMKLMLCKLEKEQ